MGDHIKFRLFLVVIFVFIGAVIFISNPFSNENKQVPVYDAAGNIVSMTTDPNTVDIEDEEVAKGIPDAAGSNIGWNVLAIFVTIINLGGAIAVVVMTGKNTVQTRTNAPVNNIKIKERI